MENHRTELSLNDKDNIVIKADRKLLPEPDSSWDVEEKSLGGDWIFYNFDFVSNAFPAAICNPSTPSAVHAISYYDDDKRLMRYELWLTHIYDKEYKKLVYEAVYTYGSKTAEVEYFDHTIDGPIKSTLVLDENGFLVEDQVLALMSYGLPFGHAIEAKYTPDPSWKRIESYWDYENEEQKSLGITFMDASNEFRRFERWLCDTNGKPYMLMREEHVEVKDSEERYVWHNRGGYIVEFYADATYLTPEGKEIPLKHNRKTFKWIIAILLVCLLAAIGFMTLRDNETPTAAIPTETIMPIAGESGTFIPKTEIPIRYDSEIEISIQSISFTASNTVINWIVRPRNEDINMLAIDPIEYDMLVIKSKGDTPEEVRVQSIQFGTQNISTKTNIPITSPEMSFTTSYPPLLGYKYINFPNSILYSTTAIKVAK